MVPVSIVVVVVVAVSVVELEVVLAPLGRIRQHPVGPTDLLEGLRVGRVPVRVVQLGQAVEGPPQGERVGLGGDAQHLVVIWLLRLHCRRRHFAWPIIDIFDSHIIFKKKKKMLVY